MTTRYRLDELGRLLTVIDGVVQPVEPETPRRRREPGSAKRRRARIFAALARLNEGRRDV